ncbi:MAG: glycosyltransferase family 9 protein [Phycisphaerales bacterium]|jgi:heptosyltransferase-2|nr:glycosyltransferase family 9 protein [Phycisphaerales bacterium]
MINWSAQHRVTVIMPTWIGDVCMATPALHLLREAMPDDGHITVGVRHGMKALLAGLPTVDHIVRLDPRGMGGPCRAGRVIASTAPDAVLVLPGSFRTAAAAWCSRSRRRVGYARDRRRWLLTDPVPQPDRSVPVSTIDWYAALVGTAAPPPPRLVVTDEDAAAAAELVQPEPAYLLLIPGANRVDKRWPVERFAGVANTAHARHGWTTVIAGAPGERDLTAAVARGCTGPTIDLAALGGSLSALKGCVAGAQVVVSNDTGPRHIATALGTPVVSLFGPTDHRWTVTPAAAEVRLLSEPFLPKDLMADRHASACGIDRIAEGDVLHAIERLAASPTR